MAGDMYGTAANGVWVYTQYAKKNMRDLEAITEGLKNNPETDPNDLNQIQIRINAIQQSITYAQDVASLILTVTKLPT